MTISLPGSIPQSSALAEASPESLSELFSRDPEGYGDQDIAIIVAELRRQRVKWGEAEAAKAAAPRPKTPKFSAPPAANPEDMDL